MAFQPTQIATTQYRATIRSAPCRAHARKYGRMGFATRGAWQYSGELIESLLTTSVAMSLKKSMKARRAAIMAGRCTKETRMMLISVHRFLLTIETLASQSDARLSAAPSTTRQSKDFPVNTSANTSSQITAIGGLTFSTPVRTRLARLRQVWAT